LAVRITLARIAVRITHGNRGGAGRGPAVYAGTLPGRKTAENAGKTAENGRGGAERFGRLK
jgi:hypothetical protein